MDHGTSSYLLCLAIDDLVRAQHDVGVALDFLRSMGHDDGGGENHSAFGLARMLARSDAWRQIAFVNETFRYPAHNE